MIDVGFGGGHGVDAVRDHGGDGGVRLGAGGDDDRPASARVFSGRHHTVKVSAVVFCHLCLCL